MTDPAGVLPIGAPRPAPGERPTIIVGGTSRSGTSNVAAALHAAGLWLGDRIDHAFFEDMELGGALEQRPVHDLRQRLRAARPGPARLALRGTDLAAVRRLVEDRNRRFATWGFKRPGVETVLRADGMRLFRDPRVVITVRDPLAVAERVAIAEHLDLVRSLGDAMRALAATMDVATRLGVPTLLVSYERMRADQRRVLGEVFSFAGMDVTEQEWAAIDEQVRASGREYARLAAGPPSGYIDEYADGYLTGWCRRVGSDDPVHVEVYVDDTLAARALADEFRPDLKKMQFGSGRFGFRVRLAGVEAGPSSRVRAVIAGTDVELERSGSLLAELASGDGPTS